ncbi:MAG: hypothetical protein GVY20_04185, partial [Bacteroidetes bacterium]|nr:hypothetical protein [Bacteroidota bacterium]
RHPGNVANPKQVCPADPPESIANPKQLQKTGRSLQADQEGNRPETGAEAAHII